MLRRDLLRRLVRKQKIILHILNLLLHNLIPFFNFGLIYYAIKETHIEVFLSKYYDLEEYWKV